MKKKVFRSMLAALVFALCVPAQAQRRQRYQRSAGSRRFPSFQTGSASCLGRELHTLGYVEGKNIAIEVSTTLMINSIGSLRWQKN